MSIFTSFFGRQNNNVIGVDIGSSSIKVVQLKREGGRAILETYGELALGPYSQTDIGRATKLSPEIVAQALVDLLKESKTTAKNAGLAIPFSSSLISIIELPEVPEKELASIIPMEARKYIPVPISEVTLDWTIVPHEKGDANASRAGMKIESKNSRETEKIDVLTVAIHNESLNRYKQIIKKAFLDTNFYELEIFGTIRALLENDPQPTMIFDMGAASTKLYIIERGVIRNSHTISKGSQDLTLGLSSALGITFEEAEVLKRGLNQPRAGQGKIMEDVFSTTLNFIFNEARRVILSYEKQHNHNVSKVFLVGGGVKLRGFMDDARKGLAVDVIPGDPFSKVTTPAFLEQVLKVTGPEFAVAVGVALRGLQELT